MYLQEAVSSPPNRPRNHCSVYILWRQQWTASAAEQRLDAATAAFSRLQLAVAAKLQQ